MKKVNKDKLTAFRMDEAELIALKSLAKQNDCNMSEVIRHLINKHNVTLASARDSNAHLTNLEFASFICLQGILSNCDSNHFEYEGNANLAIKNAKELFRQLGKEEAE